MANIKKYFTEEERIAAIRESKRKSARKWREANPENAKEKNRKYYQENSEKVKERKRKRYQENPEKKKESVKNYQSTPIGRAKILLKNYKSKDEKYGRGECTITGEWIVDNVFSGQRCFYCGETDWCELGCDRINNDLPHTPDNVVVCCEECNKKRGRKGFVEYLKEIGRLDKLKELKNKVIIIDEVLID